MWWQCGMRNRSAVHSVRCAVYKGSGVLLGLREAESPLTDECDKHESRQHAPRPGNPIDHERRLAPESQSGVDGRAEVCAAPESVTSTV